MNEFGDILPSIGSGHFDDVYAKQARPVHIRWVHPSTHYECDVQVAMCCSCLIGRQTCRSGSLPSYRLRYVVPNERLPEGPHVTLILNLLEGSSGPLELAVPALSLSLLCFLFFFYTGLGCANYTYVRTLTLAITSLLRGLKRYAQSSYSLLIRCAGI